MPVIVSFIGSYAALVCSNMDRIAGLNLFLAGLFTLSTSWITAFVAIRYEFALVIEAAVLTASIVLGVLSYVSFKKSKEDANYEMRDGIVFVFGPLFVVAVVLGAVFGFEWGLLACCGGVMVFACYLGIEFQLILTGGTYWEFTKFD